MDENHKKLHYVNNAEFYKEMKEYIAAVKKAKRSKDPLPQVTNYIGECILSIANKLANKPNFMNYPFREEMISDGVENSLQYINNFDPNKSKNPFAYFTQIIYFAFVRRIEREKKQLYTKYRLIAENLIHDADSEHLQNSKYGSDQADLNMYEFVEKFEKSKENKKKKAKENSKKRKNKKRDFDAMFDQYEDIPEQ